MNYLFSNGDSKRRMTLMLKNETTAESRSYVEIDIWPKEEGKLEAVARPINACATSFQDAIAQLRKSNQDFCESDIWDSMKEKCAIGDDINWDNVTTGSDVLNKVDLTPKT